MGSILLIARRELNAFFSTWMGYVIAFAALLINGLLFNAFAVGDKPRFSHEVLYQFFYYSSGIAMVAGIFLAMRLLAEEKTNGTIVLYFTSPLSERQVVYGKYLSVVVFFMLLQVASLYLPGLILFEGKISVGHLVSGYLGTSLLGCSVLAITLFASVVSPNQLVSGILASSITVIFLVMWILSSVVDEPLREVFSFLAIHNKHFNSFGRGLVHTKDIIFYLSMVVFFLECSIRALESRRVEG
jgi:ABC-2 type transport system permease protein